MTRKLLVLLVGSVLLLMVPGMAMAQSQLFATNLAATADQSADGGVFLRYFTADKARFGPEDCRKGFDGDYCKGNYKSFNNGYKGDVDDLFNFQVPFGTVMHGIWDHQKHAGTATHTGYFTWACKAVNAGEKEAWFKADCVGENSPATCLGNGNSSNTLTLSNTPQGTIAGVGGLSPIPVPTVSGVSGNVVSLSWEAVQGINCGVNASYDVYYYIDDLSDHTCNMPNETQFKLLRNSATNSTSVDVSADLGSDNFTAGQGKGIVFALKLHYPKNVPPDATSRYLSANGQCVSFDTGLAAEVYDLQVRYAGRNNVEVSWKTSLEDGVRGFYISRATTPDGPYTRVSNLIIASGEPSAYSFIDTITPPRGRITFSGLFYQVESVDIDDNLQVFGPTALELPNDRPVRVPDRGFRPFRRR